jgi:hypothetical protein
MMRELEIPLEMQRTLMRHSDIKSTLGYGGKTPAEHGRKSNDKVVEMLRKKACFMTVGPDSDCQPPEIEEATFAGGLFAAACLRSFPGLLEG